MADAKDARQDPLRKPTRLLLAADLALLLFVWLAYTVLMGRADALDATVRQAVHHWTSPVLTRIMFAATFIGRIPFMAGAGTLVVWRLIKAGRRHEAVLLIGGSVGGEVLLQILKLAFHRPRPAPFFGLPPPGSYSFPSGHALVGTVFYVLVTILMTRSPALRGIAVALAGLIGISRIYLGVHYPTDVFAGFAAGTAWLCGCLILRRYIARSVLPIRA